MIIKIDNKHKKFYDYMGKMFGSRLVERTTNDRIYDDNDKEWYLSLEDQRVIAFVSVSNSIIKNVYTMKEESLIELLKYIKREEKIKESIVTKHYQNLYEKARF